MNLKQFLALQKREVDEHKYFLSERCGYDIGYNAAFLDWVESPQAERFREVAEAHEQELTALCKQYCGGTCKGVAQCPVSLELIHEILED